MDSAGNLIGLPAQPGDPRPQVQAPLGGQTSPQPGLSGRLVQVSRTSVDGKKPSRSEPEGYVTLAQAQPRRPSGTDVAGQSSLYKPATRGVGGPLPADAQPRGSTSQAWRPAQVSDDAAEGGEGYMPSSYYAQQHQARRASSEMRRGGVNPSSSFENLQNAA